jgi:CheY-like chemotaxis protein
MDILVIDDERPFLEVFREWAKLSHAKMNIITAGSGKTALEMLRTAEVDVVMTDLQMPEMDGYELLRIVKQRYARLPVIVMTASGTPEIEHALRDSGAAECLDKPLDFGTVIKTLHDIQLTANSHKHVKANNV